ncbi:MAG: cobalamin biosynthesis protein CobD [Lachnospiraceae bacterium]|nr:cobalamin biosynthesis protein CobD [Lachnospiraceae bacterium]
MIVTPGFALRRIWVLLIAAAVDLLLGDPPGLWHPVQGIGRLITACEGLFRSVCGVPWRGTPHTAKARERAAGFLTVLFVLLVSVGASLLLLALFYRLCVPAGILAESILCGRLLAMRSLGEAGYAVRDPLLKGDVEGARKAVSMIVGRDTDRLDAAGIARAAVETVAENTSDGVTAPLFWMILFGGAGGVFYKAANTMDSMLGYVNDRYRFFGTAAARLDDLMNFLPSRLTALFMIFACLLPPHGSCSHGGRTFVLPDAKEALRIWRRDRDKSPSPNSAQTESVCAGALHLQLLGDTWYFGVLHKKQTIGEDDRPVRPEDITLAVRLMERTGAVTAAAGILVLILCALL